jgi:hypothetical protein
MMVECEEGLEERSSAGSALTLTIKAADKAATAGGTSYFNRTEAILAVRLPQSLKALEIASEHCMPEESIWPPHEVALVDLTPKNRA